MLIGAGGTGSHFIGQALAYLKAWHENKNEEWEFIVADGDVYEDSNLNRQLVRPEFIGRNKAVAMAEQYNNYPIRAFEGYIGRKNASMLLSEGAIIFIGVDNYSLRALVEEYALRLDNIVVVNSGNERHDGSVQIFVREGGENKTPKLSYCHPEIKYQKRHDRSEMTCAQAARLPGGEQLIIANMASALYMLTALWRVHSGEWTNGWTELQYDLQAGKVEHINMRERRNWAS